MGWVGILDALYACLYTLLLGLYCQMQYKGFVACITDGQ